MTGKCEPLRGKVSGKQFYRVSYEDVKSAVEFYKMYRDKPHWLKAHHPEIWDKFPPAEIYIYWLFDYCFGDVIE